MPEVGREGHKRDGKGDVFAMPLQSFADVVLIAAGISDNNFDPSTTSFA